MSGQAAARESGLFNADAVRSQMRRVLASRVFVNSARLSRFLEYGVESALAGQTSVSEYAVAVGAFGRGRDFDPKVDPIVRVQARRLRLKLAQYYSNEGREDEIEIQLPLRSYVPICRLQETAPPAASTVLSSIAVFPIVHLTPDSSDDFFVQGLTREIIHLLTNSTGWRIAAWSGPETRPDVQRIARQLHVDASLCGTVRKAGEILRISAELTVVSDGTVLWSDMYEAGPGSEIPVQEQIAGSICRSLRKRFEGQADGSTIY